MRLADDPIRTVGATLLQLRHHRPGNPGMIALSYADGGYLETVVGTQKGKRMRMFRRLPIIGSLLAPRTATDSRCLLTADGRHDYSHGSSCATCGRPCQHAHKAKVEECVRWWASPTVLGEKCSTCGHAFANDYWCPQSTDGKHDYSHGPSCGICGRACQHSSWEEVVCDQAGGSTCTPTVCGSRCAACKQSAE